MSLTSLQELMRLLLEEEPESVAVEKETVTDALSVSTVEAAAQTVMVSVAIAVTQLNLQLILQLVEVALTQILVSLDLSRELTMAFLTEI
jgi:hypothetical protein